MADEDDQPGNLPALNIAKGFQPGPPLDATSEDVSTMIKRAHDQGLKLWYFTASDNVSPEVIKKMVNDLNKVNAENSVISVGEDRFIASKRNASDQTLRLLTMGDSTYDRSYPIDRAFNIQQAPVVVEPALDSQVSLARKPARPQPKDLKPRCTPLGIPPKNFRQTAMPPPSSKSTPKKP